MPLFIRKFKSHCCKSGEKAGNSHIRDKGLENDDMSEIPVEMMDIDQDVEEEKVDGENVDGEIRANLRETTAVFNNMESSDLMEVDTDLAEIAAAAEGDLVPTGDYSEPPADMEMVDNFAIQENETDTSEKDSTALAEASFFIYHII